MSKLKTKRAGAESPKLVAEKVLVRLGALDLAMRNLDAFCALLKDLNARLVAGEPDVQEPHAYAVRMVRAGILQAAIGTVMACLERSGGDRASIGEILDLLKDFATLQQPRDPTKLYAKAFCSSTQSGCGTTLPTIWSGRTP